MKTTKLRKAPTTGWGRGSVGPPFHLYWGIPLPQENKFLADDVAAAPADGCFPSGSLLLHPKSPQPACSQRRSSPYRSEGRQVPQHGEPVSSQKPSQAFGPPQVFLALSACTQVRPPRAASMLLQPQPLQASQWLTRPAASFFKTLPWRFVQLE